MNIHLTNILPEAKAKPAGYIALISKYELKVPLPNSICAIGEKHKKYEKDQWRVFTPRHEPEDSLYGHLKVRSVSKGKQVSRGQVIGSIGRGPYRM